jgi:hypothetical protein
MNLKFSQNEGNAYSYAQNKGKIVQSGTQNKSKMTNREILLEMYEKLWNADKDKWSWNVILKDTLEKLEKCKHIKREGESCRLNNNCTYPDCTP